MRDSECALENGDVVYKLRKFLYHGFSNKQKLPEDAIPRGARLDVPGTQHHVIVLSAVRLSKTTRNKRLCGCGQQVSGRTTPTGGFSQALQ